MLDAAEHLVAAKAFGDTGIADIAATADTALDTGRGSGVATAEVMRACTAPPVRIYREREGFFRAFLVVGLSDETVRRRTPALIEYLHQRSHTLLAGRRHAPAPGAARRERQARPVDRHRTARLVDRRGPAQPADPRPGELKTLLEAIRSDWR